MLLFSSRTMALAFRRGRRQTRWNAVLDSTSGRTAAGSGSQSFGTSSTLMIGGLSSASPQHSAGSK